jgi:hypothetical protein
LSLSKRLISRLTTAATKRANAGSSRMGKFGQQPESFRQICCGRGALTPRVSFPWPMPRGVRAPRPQNPNVGRILKLNVVIRTSFGPASPRPPTGRPKQIPAARWQASPVAGVADTGSTIHGGAA